ncbi:MAG: leucine-rich repeat domain-containing protein [Candidatus Helarchaeota archaeon]
MKKGSKKKKKFVKIGRKKYKIVDGTLDLSEKDIRDMRDIEGLENLDDSLMELNLYRNGISEIVGLENLTTLKVLNLSSNKIKRISGLDNLVNLEELYLWGNEISKIEGLNNLVNLKKLNLEENKIQEISGLDNLVNLQELSLYDNEIREIKGLENLRNCEFVNIGMNYFPDKLLEYFNEIGVQEYLKNPKTEEEIQEMWESQGQEQKEYEEMLNNLPEHVTYRGESVQIDKERLSLDLNGLDIEKLEDVIGLESCTPIEELFLSNNKLADLDGIQHLKYLKKLYLHNNNITLIYGLENMKRLEYLSYNDNPIAGWIDNKFAESVCGNPLQLVNYCKEVVEDRSILNEQINFINDQVIEYKKQIQAQVEMQKALEQICQKCNGKKICISCEGKGFYYPKCKRCRGTGVIHGDFYVSYSGSDYERLIKDTGYGNTCPTCGGTGYYKGTVFQEKRIECEVCKGTGKCPQCNGTGIAQ